MKPILEVHNLSKEFLIGANNEPYLALRDILANPFKLLNQPKKEVFKALDNVSFDVMPGESIGIIGRNGAGKSTLLKILSKITPPSSGKIICRGRIAALLEVGTGFHPELTGRENVYMNGSILGMRKWEIDKHFDEIVNFSGVEKFLDTPLKRYSSGMQLRLAFAVAAHLEPEILIIDEVLAVGDAEFQKKCLGKMDEVTKSGRTVLFVSHNMGAVKALCNKGIFLTKGKLKMKGDIESVINQYSEFANIDKQHISNNGVLKHLDFKLMDTANGYILTFYFSIDNKSIENKVIHVFVKSRGGVLFSSSMEHHSPHEIPQGEFEATCAFTNIDLNSGNYTVDIIVDIPRSNRIESYYDIISFNVEYTSLKSQSLSLPSHIWGSISPKSSWTLVKTINNKLND